MGGTPKRQQRPPSDAQSSHFHAESPPATARRRMWTHGTTACSPEADRGWRYGRARAQRAGTGARGWQSGWARDLEGSTESILRPTARGGGRFNDGSPSHCTEDGGEDGRRCLLQVLCTPPPCISYANVHNYYSPYTYCSLAINSGKFSDRSPPTDLRPLIQCIPRHGGEAAVTVHPQIRRRRRRHSSSG